MRDSDAYGTYALFHDLLHKSDKHYDRESAFVASRLRAHAPQAHTILELGCGTAPHALLLAKQGYAMHGVDISERMIDVAKAKQQCEGLSFPLQVGDARTLRLNKECDGVVSLFNVFSFMNKKEEAEQFLATLHAHLKQGGIALFDFWHAPYFLSKTHVQSKGAMAGVISTKTVKNKNYIITRKSSPHPSPLPNTMEIHYRFELQNRHTLEDAGTFSTVISLRYFSLPEVCALVQEAGLDVLEQGEWYSGNTATEESAYAYVVVKKP